MQLLYVQTAYPPSIGGAQYLQHSLAVQLSERHRVQAVTFWDDNRTDWLRGTTISAPTAPLDYEIDGVAVHRLGFSMPEKLRLWPWVLLYYPAMDVALPKVARIIEPHLLPFAQHADLIHNVRIGREGLSFAALAAARRFDIPFVLTPVHHPRWVGWKYRQYLKLYREADAVNALTEHEKQVLVGLGVQADRIFVTGTGARLAKTADPAAFRAKHNIQGPMVLFLGQHYRYKGYLQLLEAAKAVWEKVPETCFVFAGPPVKQSEKDFEAFADPRIFCLGKVSIGEKTDALAACDVLCLPSMQESFGAVYIEAWHFAKPVIGCPIAAVAEVINDGVDGFLVEQASGPIADSICQLLQNPSLAHQMGAAGQAKAHSRYAWPVLARLTEAHYERLV